MKIRKAAVVEAMGIRLRNVRREDAAFILRLRTDPTVSRHLSPVDGGLQQQVDYIERYKDRPDEAFFIIEDLSGKPLGTVRLYDQRGDSFCWGSWIVLPAAPYRTGTKSALLVYLYGFEYLGFATSHFDVRIGNERVWRFHESWGAVLTEQTELDRLYLMTREAWETTKARYASLLQGQVIRFEPL